MFVLLLSNSQEKPHQGRSLPSPLLSLTIMVMPDAMDTVGEEAEVNGGTGSDTVEVFLPHVSPASNQHSFLHSESWDLHSQQ